MAGTAHYPFSEQLSLCVTSCSCLHLISRDKRRCADVLKVVRLVTCSNILDQHRTVRFFIIINILIKVDTRFLIMCLLDSWSCQILAFSGLI